MARDLTKIRNIGIAAHIDAGKTTVSERILYYTGKIHNPGEVHEGTAKMDFLQDEQERGITIKSAATSCPWLGHTINLIDTPGHVDFTAEVERSLRVLDGAIAVFDGKEGVEAQSETVWRQASKYNVPRLCFINKMDKLGADFEFSFNSIRQRLGAPAVAVQIPVGQSDTFEGIIDLIRGVAIYTDMDDHDDRGRTQIEKPIPDKDVQRAQKWRQELVEKVAETDERLTEKYIAGEEIGNEELKAALRRATIAFKLFPVFCGSALRYVGIQRLLDGVVDYLPSPADLPAVAGHDVEEPENAEKMIERHADPGEPFCALIFKIVGEEHGSLTYIRIYSGRLNRGTRVLNATRGRKENVSRLYRMNAQKKEDVEFAEAGDIVACVGLKDPITGDTLCDPQHPILLEKMTFPETVISMSIEPRMSADKQKLAEALGVLKREDPTFRAEFDEETGQTIISGMGELHLEILRTKLTRDMRVDVVVGKPKVAYKETITQRAEARGKFVKQTGGHGQYGDCVLRVEPCTEQAAREAKIKWEDNVGFVSKVGGGAIPREYIPAIEKGVREAARIGALANYPMVNIKVTLLDGSYHDVDSSPEAFQQAAMLAFADACQAAKPVLLEPIMKVVITTPEEFLGNITGDLSRRRGTIVHMEQRGTTRVVEAHVPLSELFGYVTDLRSMTQGRAGEAMEPFEYAPAPEQITNEIVGRMW